MCIRDRSAVVPDGGRSAFLPLIKGGDQSGVLSSGVVYEGKNPADLLGMFKPDGKLKFLAALLIEKNKKNPFEVIVAADTGEILGAHLYGQHVTDMIGEISAAMAAEGTAEELIHAIHPHPTVNEALGEAFMAAWNGRAINSL